MRALLRALVALGVISYVPVVLGWLALRWGVGEEVARVGMLNAVGLLWFVPLVILLPLALLARERWSAALLIALTGVALWLFHGELLPPLASGGGDQPRVRVLSFNALVSNNSFAEVEAMIRREQADVVAVQELSFEMADYLAPRLAAEYPHQLLHPWSDPRGIGFFSRLPISPGPELDLAGWDRWAITARVEVEGRPLVLVNLHLWPTGTLNVRDFARALRLQRAQLDALQRLLGGITEPVIVVGDLNASPTNETYTAFDTLLEDTWREAGWGPGFTWPAESLRRFGRELPPLLRIDYIWRRGPVTPLRVEVLPAAGSDHLPLVGDFAVGAP